MKKIDVLKSWIKSIAYDWWMNRSFYLKIGPYYCVLELESYDISDGSAMGASLSYNGKILFKDYGMEDDDVPLDTLSKGFAKDWVYDIIIYSIELENKILENAEIVDLMKKKGYKPSYLEAGEETAWWERYHLDSEYDFEYNDLMVEYSTYKYDSYIRKNGIVFLKSWTEDTCSPYMELVQTESGEYWSEVS